MHILSIKGAIKKLGISATAVNVLLVLDGELEDQGLVLVREGLELG